MDENEISATLVNIFLKVHRELGPGLLESVYEEIVCFELAEAGLTFTRQQAIPVIYQNKKLEIGFRADIIVENKVIIEIKSIDTIAPVHKKQLLTYLKLTDIKLGLLVNFNVNLIKDGICRVVNNL
jgi:GxxExxY protein